MSVTIFPANVDVTAYRGQYVTDTKDLFQSCCRNEFDKSIGDKMYSSFTDIEVTPTAAESNGLVHGVYAAYSHHHHLRLRPEDVWFSILTQLSFYINDNAEDLRDLFVSHDGKQELRVESPGTVDTVDLGKMATAMTDEMDKFIHDKEWKGWFLPNFTTTTDVDTATAAVLMMGTMQAYFSYTFGMTCGIPSVTLLGHKKDWVEIRNRLDKVKELGEEPQHFAERLKIVLDWFIRSFENPEDKKVVDFWTKIIADTSNGSGWESFRGWITAFCFWDQDGKKLVASVDGSLLWEGMIFERMDIEKVPVGYASVPVRIDDNGDVWHSRMTAGSVGMTLTSNTGNNSRQLGDRKASEFTKDERAALDTISPLSGWFLYEVKEEKN